MTQAPAAISRIPTTDAGRAVKSPAAEEDPRHGSESRPRGRDWPCGRPRRRGHRAGLRVTVYPARFEGAR
jgi:hypothetical protein